jgi:hypothetical protein
MLYLCEIASGTLQMPASQFKVFKLNQFFDFNEEGKELTRSS